MNRPTTHPIRRGVQGFTLLELLLACALMGMALAGLGMYFMRTNDLDRRTQAQADVQDKVRTGAQLLTQDLQTLGASRYVKNNQVIVLSDWAACTISPKCLDGTNATTGPTDTVQGRYITSLLPESDACRSFAYRITNEKLERSEQECSTTTADFVELADGILGFDIVYLCSDNTQVETPSCPPLDLGGGKKLARFVRSARFSLIGRSSQQVSGLNSTASFALPGSGQVTCPENYSCFAMTHEVQMPNLKDR
jgi:prepilin-type N-terminal cleavage/methylation domain-containing protein